MFCENCHSKTGLVCLDSSALLAVPWKGTTIPVISFFVRACAAALLFLVNRPIVSALR